MINYNNHNITGISYNNHSIKYVYGCGGKLVWSGDTPTPTTEGYLAIIPRGNGIMQITRTPNTFQYSFNSGATWNNATSATTITMNDGVPLWFKGHFSGQFNGTVTASTDFDIEGNIMSLIYGDDYESGTEIPSYTFQYFFENTPVVNASGLIISAITARANSFEKTFYNCRKLVSVPKLNVTRVIGRTCYSMFGDCKSLTYVPSDMLPSTSLGGMCYDAMFQGCSSLTNAPDLPATTLAYGCYTSMFSYCTSLTKAPELPAATLADKCYTGMFGSCTSLNEITCLATDVSASNCTEQWVDGVAANGTFTKASGFLGWSQGVDGIPNGWTVVDA